MIWGTVGSHSSFYFDPKRFDEIFDLCVNDILKKIKYYLENYEYIEINLFQLSIVNIGRLPDLLEKNINNLKIEKKLVNMGETKRKFNQLLFYYGIRLNKNKISNGNVMIKTLSENTWDLIKKTSKIVNSFIDVDFYLYTNGSAKKKRWIYYTIEKIRQ